MAERLLTVAEVAESLQAHPKTVQRWIREGRLKAHRIGGQKLGYRIREADLEAFIEGGATGQGEHKAAA